MLDGYLAEPASGKHSRMTVERNKHSKLAGLNYKRDGHLLIITISPFEQGEKLEIYRIV